MSDEQLSKRERQKQRRQAKKEREQADQRTARLRQAAAIGLVILVVLGGIGLVVANQIGERNERAARAEAVAARLDELGCTEVTTEEDFGGGQHIPGAALAGNAPETLYTTRPASAGPHLGQVTASGVFDATIDERLVVHNLEHGYVTFWWDPDAPQETIDAVRQFVDDNLDEYPKLIAAPYNTDLPAEQAVTTVAWTQRQECTEFDPDVALAFLDDHYGLAGVAPEKNLQPHDEGGQGVLVPDAPEQPLLFPPLDTSGGSVPDAEPLPDDPPDATEG